MAVVFGVYLMRAKTIFIVCIVSIIISVILCTLGFSPTSVPIDSVATMWPGAITQAITAILFGGWGIVITVLSGVFVDIINVGDPHITFGFMLPDFIQAFIPALYYPTLFKKLSEDDSVDFRFGPYLFYAVLLPNILGAMVATFILHQKTGVSMNMVFARWLIANIPIAILFGWPLVRFLGPVMVEEKLFVKGWWK